MQELMYLHVDLSTRRVEPFPHKVRERVGAAASAHAQLPRPDWAGRRIAMPGRAGSG
jgi:acyl-CoA thioester hydrolase